MNHKTVKELKEKIEAEVKEDFDFEQHLFKKYPSLFYTGIDGELLPQFQRCWNDCPKGWETIVDNLFGCIDDYIKNTTKSKVNPKKKIKAWVYKNIGRKIISQIDRLFNPYRNIDGFYILSSDQRAKMEKKFSTKVRKLTTAVRARFINGMHVYYKPEQVKITQYKEKFGTLRIYVDGGDDEVDGMIRFAEYLSSVTCQNTGKKGSMRNLRSWSVTLCDEEYNKILSKNKIGLL